MTIGCTESAADLIIPVHNEYARTRNLIEGIYRYTDTPFHIYIIDNASSDETAEMHKIYTRDITIVHNRESRGWAGGINQGIELGRNPYVVFLKNRVEVSHSWLGNLISFLDTHPRIGAVGPLDSNRRDRQSVDRVREELVPQIPQFLTEDIHERNRILRYHFPRAGVLIEGVLDFFCVALRRRTIGAVGLLEEDARDGNSNRQYCRRLRESGYVLGLSLDTYVLHDAGPAESTRSRAEVQESASGA